MIGIVNYHRKNGASYANEGRSAAVIPANGRGNRVDNENRKSVITEDRGSIDKAKD
jgi:hypothetical protein